MTFKFNIIPSRIAVACATVVLTAEVLASATATLNWTLSDGKVVTETQELRLFADGVALTVSRDKILQRRSRRG